MKSSYLFIAILLFLFSSCSKDPQEVANNLPEDFRDFATVFSGEGIGGIISLSYESHILISTDGDKYAWFEGNQVTSEWELSNSEGPFKNLPTTINHVETGMILQPYKDPNYLYLVVEEGRKYMACRVNGNVDDNNNWENPNFYFDDFSEIRDVEDQWGTDGTYPIGTIGACIKNNYVGCLNGISVALEEFLLVNKEGNQLIRYKVDGLVNSPPSNIESLTNFSGAGCPPDEYDTPFASIGAIALMETKSGQLAAVYFSKEGKSFAYYTEGDSSISEKYSL